MNEIDPQALARAAGAAWMILVGLLAVTFAVLSLLIPLFVWRIWHWTRATCRQAERINTRLDQLLILLAPREEAARGDGEFLFGSAEPPEEEKTSATEPSRLP